MDVCTILFMMKYLNTAQTLWVQYFTIFYNWRRQLWEEQRHFIFTVTHVPVKTKKISLSYFMSRVGLGYHNWNAWHFMNVGHTKFKFDEEFGNICKHVGR